MRVLEGMGKLVGLLLATIFLMSALTSTPNSFSPTNSQTEISSAADCAHHHDESPVPGHHHCLSCERVLATQPVVDFSPISFRSLYGLSDEPSMHDDPELHGPVEPPRA